MKTKKTVKGFTLIELIIVCALFSLIMIGAMALLKPVSTFYKQSVEYEAARSTTDMIGDYLEGTLRFSNKIFICDKYKDFDDAWIEDAAKNRFGIIDATSEVLTTDMYEISVDNADAGHLLVRKWEAGKKLNDPSALTTSRAISEGIYTEHSFEIAIADYSVNVGGTSPVIESFNVDITAHQIQNGVVDTEGGITKNMQVRLLNINGSDTYPGADNPRLLTAATNRAHLNMNTDTASASPNFHIFFVK